MFIGGGEVLSLRVSEEMIERLALSVDGVEKVQTDLGVTPLEPA